MKKTKTLRNGIEPEEVCKLERDSVKAFLEKINFPCFIDNDLDSSNRVFKSGQDFILSANGRVMYVEAKRPDNKKTFKGDSFEMLSDWQKETAFMCKVAKVPYLVLEFIKGTTEVYLYRHSDFELIATGEAQILGFFEGYLHGPGVLKKSKKETRK